MPFDDRDGYTTEVSRACSGTYIGDDLSFMNRTRELDISESFVGDLSTSSVDNNIEGVNNISVRENDRRLHPAFHGPITHIVVGIAGGEGYRADSSDRFANSDGCFRGKQSLLAIS